MVHDGIICSYAATQKNTLAAQCTRVGGAAQAPRRMKTDGEGMFSVTDAPELRICGTSALRICVARLALDLQLAGEPS
jgi:hypothetical protein